jgi:copper chaperone NosL
VRHLAAFTFACVVVACGRGPAAPAQPDTKHDACGWCRMAVSDLRFAAQLAAPSEEPRFFDDIGCLATFLKSGGAPARGQVAWVSDHRTKQWIRASSAVYTKVPGLLTPMNSFLVAHADAASRDADESVAGGARMTLAEVFGPNGVPDGR